MLPLIKEGEFSTPENEVKQSNQKLLITASIFTD